MACVEYRRKGVFNCLLSNGEWLFSFCSTKLAEITRRAPFGPAQLRDAELTVNFHAETTPDDVVTVLATEPLTNNEQWTLHEPGQWSLWASASVSPGEGGRVLRSYLRLTLFAFGLLVGIQVPGFIEAYVQHVEARRLEAQQGLQGFQQTAQRFFGGDLDALVRHYQDSDDPVFQSDAQSVEQLVSRARMLEREWQAMQGPWYARAAHVLLGAQRSLREQVWSSYRFQVLLARGHRLGPELCVAPGLAGGEPVAGRQFPASLAGATLPAVSLSVIAVRSAVDTAAQVPTAHLARNFIPSSSPLRVSGYIRSSTSSRTIPVEVV